MINSTLEVQKALNEASLLKDLNIKKELESQDLINHIMQNRDLSLQIF